MDQESALTATLKAANQQYQRYQRPVSVTDVQQVLDKRYRDHAYTYIQQLIERKLLDRRESANGHNIMMSKAGEAYLETH